MHCKSPGLRFQLVLAALFVSTIAHGATVEEWGALPAISNIHLSPDGTHFSAIEPVNGHPAVLVFEIHPAPGIIPHTIDLADGAATDTMWVNNDRIICFFYEHKYLDESTGVNLRQVARSVSVSLSGKRTLMLAKGTPMYFGPTTEVLGRSADDPNVVFMNMYRDTSDVFAVNVDTNDTNALAIGTQNTGQWFIDDHGEPLGRVDSTNEFGYPKSTDTIFVNDAGTWRETGTYSNFEGATTIVDGVAADASALVVERIARSGIKILETLPIKSSMAPNVLFSEPKYDLLDVRYDEWSGRVIGASYLADKKEFRYFDPELAHVQKRLEAALPGQSVELSSWDKKRERYLVTASGPHNAFDVYLFAPKAGTLEYLMNAYPTLQPSDMSDQRPYPYKAHDGLEIPAYLTLPTGRDPHKLPTVVFPHGGPDARDALGFDWMAQFFASRGYAVVQPNFRGSAGYGESFQKAGFGEWGRKMQDDISDGVRKLIEDGIADPKRICIVGASYGGYAALAGATFTPELYACAISYAGISDIAGMLGHTAQQQGSHTPAMRYWEKRIGNRFSDVKAQQDISPAGHADNVRAPVLLLHSDQDLTVPYAQSLREETALQRANKAHQLVILKGDDHYMTRSDTRVAVLKNIEAFLAANIGASGVNKAQ